MYLLIATWLSITLIALIVGDGGLFLGKLTWLPVNVCSRHCWASVLWMERLKECVAWRWSSLRGLLSWLHVRLGWLFLLSWIVSRLTTLYWLQCFLEVLIAFLRLEFEFLEQRVARLCPSYLICLTCDILIFLCFIFWCKFISIEFLDGVNEGSMRCFRTALSAFADWKRACPQVHSKSTRCPKFKFCKVKKVRANPQEWWRQSEYWSTIPCLKI